jgi:predicted amidohydrolase
MARVAAIQAEPAWWDLKAGVTKTISLIKEAASNGAELIGFPESFIPGYPMAIWARPFDPAFLVQFQKNCLSVQSEEFKEILAAAKEAGIWLVCFHNSICRFPGSEERIGLNSC